MLKHEVVCGWSNVKRGLLITLGLLALSLLLNSASLMAQAHDQNSSDRKVLTRVEP
jgi:hypothetical protein